VIVEKLLREILEVIQQDVGNRGLAKDPAANLFNACPEDFVEGCRSLADQKDAHLGVVTGFWIPGAECGETDGPLGAVYLARTLPELGIPVVLVSDPFCRSALDAGLAACCQAAFSPVLDVQPSIDRPMSPKEARERYARWWEHAPSLTHLLALERVGWSHDPSTFCPPVTVTTDFETLRQFLEEVPVERMVGCYTMRGVDISDKMRDASRLFEYRKEGVVTIGVGDGGNEIGMGKIPWSVIRNNIPNGGRIACRVATDFLIVAGVSNWGAYALASGVALMKDITPPAEWFDADRERAILREMVEKGPLVDGVTGQRIDQVDGLTFDEYIKPLRKIERIVRH
jgi:hypothetical protein